LREELLRTTGPNRAAVGVLRQLRADALPFLRETLEMRGRDLTKHRPGAGDPSPRARRILSYMASVAGPKAVPEFQRIIEDSIRDSKDSFLLGQVIEVGRLSFPKPLEESFRKRYLDRRGILSSTRARLLKALAAVNPKATAPLLATAAESGSVELHYAVLETVFSLGPRCDRKGLLEGILRTSRSCRVLKQALPLAGQTLGEDVEHLILPRLEDPDLRIRKAAVEALTSRKCAENAARLRKLFRDMAATKEDDARTLERKDRLRHEIIKSLPHVAPEPDLTFLREALTAEEYAVREATGWTLARHPGVETATVVMEANRPEGPHQGPDPMSRQGGARANPAHSRRRRKGRSDQRSLLTGNDGPSRQGHPPRGHRR